MEEIKNLEVTITYTLEFARVEVDDELYEGLCEVRDLGGVPYSKCPFNVIEWADENMNLMSSCATNYNVEYEVDFDDEDDEEEE